jgi:LCP family protein required for cell wall assembly
VAASRVWVLRHDAVQLWGGRPRRAHEGLHDHHVEHVEHDAHVEHDEHDEHDDQRGPGHHDEATGRHSGSSHDKPAGDDQAALSSVRQSGPTATGRVWRRVVVPWLALLLIVPACAWVLRSSGPVRDREVGRELSQTHGLTLTFVVVGTDSRQSVRTETGDRFGPRDAVTTEWADTVMLVRLERDTGSVKVLSLPRELVVDADGEQKLGATLESGGPRGVVRAVRQITGFTPHHYVELDFLGFARLVDRLGGVTLDLPAPARDLTSGLTLARGMQPLDGNDALAYARSRFYEEWREGAWTMSSNDDLARIHRQHRLLGAIAAQRASLPRVKQLWGDRALARHVTLDATLSIGTLQALLRDFGAAPLVEADVLTLPSVPLVEEGQAVSPFPPAHVGTVGYLVPAQPAASEVIAGFASIRR